MKKYLNEIFLISIISVAISIFSSYASDRIVIAQDGKVYLTSYKEWHYIQRYDSVTKEFSRVLSVSDPTYCHINSVFLDPTGTKVVYCGACRYRTATTSNEVPKGFYFLKVINRKNMKEIVSFDHGQTNFSFSPDSDAIVYAEEIPGEAGSPAPLGYQGGAWIYNFNTKAKKHLNLAVVDINWSSHDGNIYSMNGIDVYRYNLKTGKIEAVPYHGIYFSPDGKYNLSKTGYGIFRTQDNREMTGWEDMIRRESDHYRPTSTIVFVCWCKKLNAAIFNVGGDNYVIFDPVEGKVLGRFRAIFTGINPEGTKAAVGLLGPDGRPQSDKIEILNLLDLIKK